MNKSKYLLSIPVIYSSFMLYKSPSISDSLIVASLCGLVGFICYISAKYNVVVDNSEVAQLERDHQLETMKFKLEHLRETAVQEKASRDARASMLGGDIRGQIKF